MNDVIGDQRAICSRYDAPWVAALDHLKLGIAGNVRSGLMPINGLRHPPEGDTSGWYIWAGEELSNAPDFFEPMHIAHLAEVCPSVLRFLGLPPGWRFLAAEDYVDVWKDAQLLEANHEGESV